MKICKQCGAVMKEDAWEEIDMIGERTIIDAFSAWICEKHCGYYEKMDGEIEDEQ